MPRKMSGEIHVKLPIEATTGKGIRTVMERKVVKGRGGGRRVLPLILLSVFEFF